LANKLSVPEAQTGALLESLPFFAFAHSLPLFAFAH
jgi:hypothetical protein